MTNLEYITSQLGRFGLDQTDLTAILVARDIVPTADANTVDVRKAIYNEIPLLIAGLQDISEGGLSIKWNTSGIKLWYSVLAKELALQDNLNEKPTITYAGNRW